MQIMSFYPTFSLDEIENWTWDEYLLRVDAYRFRNENNKQLLFQIPIIDRAIKATDKDGKYVYKQLDEVYDYKEAIGIIDGTQKAKANRLRELNDRYERAKRLAKEQEMRKGGK